MATKRTPKRGSPLSRAKLTRKKSARSKPADQTLRVKPVKKILRCPIVGIGGSAGGFEAAMELLHHLPSETGMAFVIVQHLDPHHASQLSKLLGKATPMPVIELAGTTSPRPDTIYVQPANKCVIVKDDTLTLVRRTQKLNLAIDHFFESLAKERGSRAIGIVLSGTGTDGTAGLRAIKAAGGLTFAQSERSAKFDAMPRSAIRAGFVDMALPPREIAQEIQRVAEHPYIRRSTTVGERAEVQKVIYREANDLGRIFLSLRKQMGVDFSSYKHATLLRRIQRRMALHRMEKVSHYAKFLRDNKKENEALFDDLLINVTHFFRDARMFRELKRRFLPALWKNKSKDRAKTLRVWVPGCATGEEVYSLAIAILETLDQRGSNMNIRIFGTDLSESTIERARAGIYSSAIEKDVSRSRLRRFFSKRDGAYQINRKVRDFCTFARQNITADPPFSRLDLISCRNVLIYLSPQLHKHCIPQFHYALNRGGYLILGPAESVGFYDKLFEAVDRKNKIYAKKNVPTPRIVDLVSYRGYEFPETRVKSTASDHTELLEMADRIMLSAYAPAAVVIDRALHIEQFRGRAEDYLEQIPGPATRNLLQLVRPSLVADLRAIIDLAIETDKPARKERALVKFDGKTREVNIEVVPFKLAASDKSWLLVIFDETTKGTRPGRLLEVLGRTTTQREMSEMRKELTASQSAGQELLSRNEGLQLINEELETAKEELQSTNEELTTLNDELSNRNLEMMQLTSDLDNLLTSIQIPIVMVDRALMVRRATPGARNAFNILPTDIGRRITELRPNVDLPDLENILHDVIETLGTRERKVTDKEGRDYSLRVRPYRTIDNKIDGAVISLVDLEGGKDRYATKTPRRPK
ncbi:MAG TPA: chemotaxis protein CheB [Candidatus Udaeobacter sp.]|nr:chemotaxis protein CheB [Candidatus Udaeobacter sp.]